MRVWMSSRRDISPPGAGRMTTASDDVLTRLVGRLSTTAALLLGAAVYVGIGLALPLGMGSHGVVFVACNVTGVSLAFAITLSWLYPRIQASQRRHLLDSTTDFRKLSAPKFEWLVAEVLRREGWNITETDREGAADGNIDIRARRDDRPMPVECKRWWSTPVGVSGVRELAGTLRPPRRPRGPRDAVSFHGDSDCRGGDVGYRADRQRRARSPDRACSRSTAVPGVFHADAARPFQVGLVAALPALLRQT